MREYKEKITLFFVYFFIALCIGVFVRDVSLQPDLFLTLTSCLTLYGDGDPGSFATAGLDIYHYGWVTHQHQWIFHFWPPGFMMLEGYIPVTLQDARFSNAQITRPKPSSPLCQTRREYVPVG